MSTGKHRSTWVSSEEPRQQRRRRPRLLITATLSGLATAAVVGGTLVGFGATPALALCSDDGSCVNTASTASSVEVLPIRKDGDAVLTVDNDGAAGTAKVGVVGYLQGDEPSQVKVVETAPNTTATVAVPKGDKQTVRLTGVPAGASAVMLQVGGVDSPQVRSSWRATNGASARTARLHITPNHDRLTKAQVLAAMRAWASRTSSAMPSSEAIASLIDRVGAASGTPAHLAAAIGLGPKSLRVAWKLQAGAENVTAVRVTRDGTASDGSPLTADRPARSGSYTMKSLEAGRQYTVTVAPVIDGKAGVPITMQAAPLAADGSGAPSSAPTGSGSPSPSSSASSAPTASASGTPSTSGSPAASGSPSASSSTRPTRGTAGSSSPQPSSGGSATPSPSTSTGSSSSSGSGSGSSAVPAAPAGYTTLFSQTFDKNAALGSFTKTYPGYSGYDGGTDTSRTAGRSADRTGLWNNSTTSSVSNGVYNCHLFTQGSRPQVCALTPTPNGSYWSGQMYGRYSVRFKTDKVPGYKIAYLLWPSSDNWNDGEIDFPEGDLDGSITGSVHNVKGNPSQNAYWVDTKAGMSQWQTATIDWRPGRVTFMLGDQSWTTTDQSGIPTKPMRWALQAETQIAAQAPSTSAAGDLQIDWLAAYSYTDG